MALDLIARWPQPEEAHIQLLRKAGIEVAPDAALSGVVTRGVWPGIRRPGQARSWNNDLFASASAEPWIDSNLYLVPFERALTGRASPVIGYEAGPATGLPADRSVPFETLEVALIEARLQGGNYVLSFDPRYRAALVAGDARALEALTSLGRTGAWLREQSSLFGLAAPPAITALVEPGNASAEIANLLYRRNGSPRLEPASAPPSPDGQRILVLVAASLKAVPKAVWKHAEAGSTVAIDDASLVNPAWRRVKEEPDRDFYQVGKGRVVVYKRRVAEPSEFALDMIDIVGHQRRIGRVWNAMSTVVFSTAGPATGEALLHVINYGAPLKDEIQARIHGHYTQATLLRPEAPPATLKTQPRGLATEVFLPGLTRVGVVRFRA
jgi:hypothetical protein